MGLRDPSHQGSSAGAVMPSAVWFHGRLGHRMQASCCIPDHHLTVNSKLLEYRDICSVTEQLHLTVRL